MLFVCSSSIVLIDDGLILTLTISHGDRPLLDPGDVAAELVLLLAVLDQLSLDAEAPHRVQVAAVQLHLVQDLGTHLNHLVRLQLKLRNGENK